MGSDRRIVRVSVRGRVQGVWFRDWTRRTATDLGLSGWVRNRRDGSVEALFAGTPDSVADMLGRCRVGPPMARVDEVALLPEGADEAPAGFDILPTA